MPEARSVLGAEVLVDDDDGEVKAQHRRGLRRRIEKREARSVGLDCQSAGAVGYTAARMRSSQRERRTRSMDGCRPWWWIATGRAGGRRAGHRHLLPADARARRWRRRRIAAHAGAGLQRRSWSRPRWSAAARSPPWHCSGAAPTRTAPPAEANRDVNLDIGERVHVTALGRRRHRARPVPRRHLDGALCRRRHAAARASTSSAPSKAIACIARAAPSHSLDNTGRKHHGNRRSSSCWSSPRIFVVRSLKVVPQQHAWVVERLGKYHAHADAGPELPGALRRPRGLQALAEGDSARRAEPGVHHQGQHAARRSTASCTSRSPTPMRASYGSSATTWSPSRSWRRPRCAA